jgi:hypothetical protein
VGRAGGRCGSGARTTGRGAAPTARNGIPAIGDRFPSLVDVDVVVTVVVAVGLGVPAFLAPFRLMRREPIGKTGMKLGGARPHRHRPGLPADRVADRGGRRDAGDRPGLRRPAPGRVQDQWTVLQDKEEGEPLHEGRWVLVLGESEGMFALYDCDKLETGRRPAESVVLARSSSTRARGGFTCGGLAG